MGSGGVEILEPPHWEIAKPVGAKGTKGLLPVKTRAKSGNPGRTSRGGAFATCVCVCVCV